MHELSIVFEVIDQVEKIAEANKAKSVSKITLELGEVSSVIPEYFRDCYAWAIKKSKYMKECELNLIVVKAESYCKDCHKVYSTTAYGKECPVCHSTNTYLLSGNDFTLRDIAIKEEKEETKGTE